MLILIRSQLRQNIVLIVSFLELELCLIVRPAIQLYIYNYTLSILIYTYIICRPITINFLLYKSKYIYVYVYYLCVTSHSQYTMKRKFSENILTFFYLDLLFFDQHEIRSKILFSYLVWVWVPT